MDTSTSSVTTKEIKILETVEDIQERRESVLGRYKRFKEEAKEKRSLLEDSKKFQYFKRDADELESWILEKLQTASDESYKDPTNLQAKIQKHQAFEAEVTAHSDAIVSLSATGGEMINQGHFASEVITHRLNELHRLWELLLSKLADKGVKLQQALVLVQFNRQCDEVMSWINDKEAFVTSDEMGHDLEHVEVLQRKFDEFQKEMTSQEFRVQEVYKQADKLVEESHPDYEIIVRRRNEVEEAWKRLRHLTQLRQQKLAGAQEIQIFNRDADETISWILEKDLVLSSDDYGKDLVSVQALQRKHEGIERDLAALEDKVLILGQEAHRLCELHPDHRDKIQAKHSEIVSNWDKLKSKASGRKRRLDESHLLHQFLADFRDLTSWINDMKTIINADELAKDVAGAEALLERHQEHKGEIDARMDSFKSADDAGKILLDQGIATDEVRDKLMALSNEKNSLLELWENRRILYEQCMDLQLFYRDTEQADTWMAKQEAFLANEDLGDSLDSVEALIKKHEDFEKSLAAQEEKIKALDEFATKVIEGQHYAAEDVARMFQNAPITIVQSSENEIQQPSETREPESTTSVEKVPTKQLTTTMKRVENESPLKETIRTSVGVEELTLFNNQAPQILGRVKNFDRFNDACRLQSELFMNMFKIKKALESSLDPDSLINKTLRVCPKEWSIKMSARMRVCQFPPVYFDPNQSERLVLGSKVSYKIDNEDKLYLPFHNTPFRKQCTYFETRKGMDFVNASPFRFEKSFLNSLDYAKEKLYTYHLGFGFFHRRYVGFIKELLEQRKHFNPFSQGELEILCYIYWDLETQDICHFNESNSKDFKRAFINLCLDFKEKVVDNQELNLPEKQDFWYYLCQYGMLSHQKVLHVSTIWAVKQKFTDFINFLKKCAPNLVVGWIRFFEIINVHHFFCLHTMATLYKKYRVFLKTGFQPFPLSEPRYR